jgi:DNA helicase II / ATP-dependent DNA helicase PcrA
MDLNEGQKAAVEYGIGVGRPSAPLLIIAGAGTGKTKTLAHRVARLVLNGTDPQRILLLTFTRRAAAEMTRRAARILARRAAHLTRSGQAFPLTTSAGPGHFTLLRAGCFAFTPMALAWIPPSPF